MNAGHSAGEDLDDEGRVLRCIEEHAEDGISTFAMASELDLRASVVSPIVDRLERDRRIYGKKRGVIFYWHPGPAPDEDEEAAAWERLADGGPKAKMEGPTLEDLKAELEAMPEVSTSSHERAEHIECPVPGCGCKNRGKRALDNMFTHLKVKHGLSRTEARRQYDLPWDNAHKDTGNAPQPYCRRPGCTAGQFPDGLKRHGHESFCKHNPKAIDKAEGEGPEPSITTDARPMNEEQYHELPCDGDGCTIALPRSASLEEFAELHRHRLRKDIRTMKRAEKRLARRSASALGMMTRIHEARATKERELRRFDRELEEVGRRDHPLP